MEISVNQPSWFSLHQVTWSVFFVFAYPQWIILGHICMTLASFPWTLCIFKLVTENMHNGKTFPINCNENATETTFITTTGHMTLTWHGAACVDGEINKEPVRYLIVKQQRSAAFYPDLQEETRERRQIMEKSQTETFSGEKKHISEHPPSCFLERLHASGNADVFYLCFINILELFKANEQLF